MGDPDHRFWLHGYKRYNFQLHRTQWFLMEHFLSLEVWSLNWHQCRPALEIASLERSEHPTLWATRQHQSSLRVVLSFSGINSVLLKLQIILYRAYNFFLSQRTDAVTACVCMIFDLSCALWTNQTIRQDWGQTSGRYSHPALLEVGSPPLFLPPRKRPNPLMLIYTMQSFQDWTRLSRVPPT